MSGGAMRGRGSRRSGVFGGLRGAMSYADNSFDDLDPDIQRMFYDDDDHQGDARQAARRARAGALQLLTADRVLLGLGRDFILNATK